MLNVFNLQSYTDLMLVIGAFRFQVHRFMLATSSNAFYRLLTMDISDMGARSSSESSMVSYQNYIVEMLLRVLKRYLQTFRLVQHLENLTLQILMKTQNILYVQSKNNSQLGN